MIWFTLHVSRDYEDGRKEKFPFLLSIVLPISEAISSSIKGSNDTLNFKSNYNRSLLSERYLREHNRMRNPDTISKIILRNSPQITKSITFEILSPQLAANITTSLDNFTNKLFYFVFSIKQPGK